MDPRHFHLMCLPVYRIYILFCSVVTNICKCSGAPNGGWDAQHGALSWSRKRSVGRAKLSPIGGRCLNSDLRVKLSPLRGNTVMNNAQFHKWVSRALPQKGGPFCGRWNRSSYYHFQTYRWGSTVKWMTVSNHMRRIASISNSDWVHILFALGWDFR